MNIIFLANILINSKRKLIHKGYPNAKHFAYAEGRAFTSNGSIDVKVTLLDTWPRSKKQYTVHRQSDVFVGKSNYESYIDLLKVLIEQLVENLDYNAYKDNTSAFDDVEGFYDGWDLETFATSGTFVTQAMLEGIIIRSKSQTSWLAGGMILLLWAALRYPIGRILL